MRLPARGATTKGGPPIFDAEDIRDWRGESVVDLNGAKIGSLEDVYLDTASDQPVFATVRIGLPGRQRLVFVPLLGARVAPRYVRVLAEKSEAKGAPSIPVGGELTAAAEPGIFAHFHLDYVPGASGERRLGRR